VAQLKHFLISSSAVHGLEKPAPQSKNASGGAAPGKGASSWGGRSRKRSGVYAEQQRPLHLSCASSAAPTGE